MTHSPTEPEPREEIPRLITTTELELSHRAALAAPQPAEPELSYQKALDILGMDNVEIEELDVSVRKAQREADAYADTARAWATLARLLREREAKEAAIRQVEEETNMNLTIVRLGSDAPAVSASPPETGASFIEDLERDACQPGDVDQFRQQLVDTAREFLEQGNYRAAMTDVDLARSLDSHASLLSELGRWSEYHQDRLNRLTELTANLAGADTKLICLKCNGRGYQLARVEPEEMP